MTNQVRSGIARVALFRQQARRIGDCSSSKQSSVTGLRLNPLQRSHQQVPLDFPLQILLDKIFSAT